MLNVDYKLISHDLRQLGVDGRRPLIAHSSLSSFGRVEGGAEAVVDALLDAVGPKGSIFVPTFNFGQLSYDPPTTKSLTGAVTEAFRQRKNALRSPHPTHPMSGIGPAAERVLREHPIMHPFGENSPLWKLWREDAQIVLLGCDHRSNSMIHVAEEMENVPYLNRTRVGRVIENGVEREITVRRPPCSNGFNAIDHSMRWEGKLREGKIGEARVLLMEAREVIDVTRRLLRENPAALLCNEPSCVICPESRRMIDKSFPDRGQQI